METTWSIKKNPIKNSYSEHFFLICAAFGFAIELLATKKEDFAHLMTIELVRLGY